MKKNEKDISQYIIEKDLLQYGIVTPNMLHNTRLILMVVYNLKNVDILCDTNKFTIDVEVKFHGFLGSIKALLDPTISIKYKLKNLKWLFKPKQIIKHKIYRQLEDSFMQFEIKVI